MSVVVKAGSSMERVIKAAEALTLDIELKTFEQSTRTAEDAAAACGCAVGQIVKSLVFLDGASDRLVLLLVGGHHNANTEHLRVQHGLELARCDGRRVRDETGFAIGGVAPIGHLQPLPVFMDVDLLAHAHVWAAAGRPDSVFKVDPKALATACQAVVTSVTA